MCVWSSLVVSKHAELHNISFTVVHGGVNRLTEWECKQRLNRDIIWVICWMHTFSGSWQWYRTSVLF